MIYVHLATGFEEIEALTVVDILRRASIDVNSVSMEDDLLVLGSRGITAKADILFADADYEGCEMIVLPGGMPGTTNLMANAELGEHIKDFAAAGKKVAAICAAPMVLGHLGVLKGKNATIYPGMEENLIGATHTAGKVVVDGNITTSKGPGTAMAFALEIVKQIKGEEVAAQVREGLLYEE